MPCPLLIQLLPLSQFIHAQKCPASGANAIKLLSWRDRTLRSQTSTSGERSANPQRPPPPLLYQRMAKYFALSVTGLEMSVDFIHAEVSESGCLASSLGLYRQFSITNRCRPCVTCKTFKWCIQIATKAASPLSNVLRLHS
ncbi:hypothetical protein BKA70DRAFT_1238408 [Coprinopsis sp. MPI-PUGE-AT-0042]|nr:hypothetical protein BKA70DRAFT_1238408 [Coprinopsis sp. MPI-PUGE-AT-0042]